MASRITIEEFQEHARFESIDIVTNDVEILDKLVGVENWTFLPSVAVQEGMVVVNGTLTIVFLDETVDETPVEIKTAGAAIVGVQTKQAVGKAIRVARQMALARWGFPVEAPPDGVLAPAPASPSSAAAPRDPNAVFCEEEGCGKQLESYIAKSGREIDVKSQVQMTKGQYQKVLCKRCNGVRFAKSKKAGTGG